MSNRSIHDGFVELIKKLEPNFSESEISESNLSDIERCLKSSFDMNYMINYGSIGHGTHISGYSSTDCFAVIPKKHLFEDSHVSLKKVHECLLESFPNASMLEGRPVISISYGEKAFERHNIVPAFQNGQRHGHDVFGIPGPSQRWVSSCPGGHSERINKVDTELSSQLKSMIRLVKAWNYYNNQPLWSFYVELAMAEFLKTDYSVMYAQDFRNFLRYLQRRELAPIENSIGSNEPVYATPKDQKIMALGTLDEAIYKSGKAVKFESRGNIAEAYYWWGKVFNFHFPKY